ncbi:hypothetical protein ACT29H_16500 [Thermophagus sp. OGC60D27]|uniref:hypothetical protein n=1 Tax=Thermophagus sp. OGC60D27 TaxID=3458415 RepID=UPI00403832A5
MVGCYLPTSGIWLLSSGFCLQRAGAPPSGGWGGERGACLWLTTLSRLAPLGSQADRLIG